MRELIIRVFKPFRQHFDRFVVRVLINSKDTIKQTWRQNKRGEIGVRLYRSRTFVRKRIPHFPEKIIGCYHGDALLAAAFLLTR
jgi:hypothetical protein